MVIRHHGVGTSKISKDAWQRHRLQAAAGALDQADGWRRRVACDPGGRREFISLVEPWRQAKRDRSAGEILTAAKLRLR